MGELFVKCLLYARIVLVTRHIISEKKANSFYPHGAHLLVIRERERCSMLGSW